jgi:hypothetical protein
VAGCGSKESAEVVREVSQSAMEQRDGSPKTRNSDEGRAIQHSSGVPHVQEKGEMTMKSVLVVLMGLVLCGCSGGKVTESALPSAVLPSVVVAPPQAPAPQMTYGFTHSAPEVVSEGDGLYFINAEAVSEIGNPVQHGIYSVPFPVALPPNGTIVSFEGTISFRTACGQGQALGLLQIDGKHYAPSISKAPFGGGVVNSFIKYSTPLKYTAGQAEIIVATDIDCGDSSKPTTWEIQGLLKVN